MLVTTEAKNERARPPLSVASTDDGALVIISAPLPDASSQLTSAERAVAELAARGASNARIANERGTSVRTVANQIAACLRKLGLSSRAELARLSL